ncbi:hypothetical protein ACNF40_05310 [Cuniculiplasma sp. SKW4]|uniref:hypothetical protein n=1 Tax=Cuniculiplasma sp. SKW4 TaxID=3400171 RepID=UPI003FD37F90
MRKSKIFLAIFLAIALLCSLYGYHEYEIRGIQGNQKVDRSPPIFPVNITNYILLYNAVNLTGEGSLYFNLPSGTSNVKIIALENKTDGTICIINPTGGISGKMVFNYCTPSNAICGPVLNSSFIGKWTINYNLYMGKDGNDHVVVYYD